MITPEKASKKRMFLYSGIPPPSKETAVRLMAVHNTGRSTGKDITVKSDVPLPVFETMAPRIVVTDAIAILPENSVSIKSILYTGSIWRKNRYRGVTSIAIERYNAMLKTSFEI